MNPILNLQGAADPSGFQGDLVASAMVDLDVVGSFDAPMAGYPFDLRTHDQRHDLP
jgi:hypothetical protein